MIVSAHQPVYLPSAMLMNKMALSDVFVFLSHVQFLGRSWQQRNRIRNGSQAIFLTVPVKKKGQRFQAISEVVIQNENDWARTHLTAIRMAYAKRPHFSRYFPEFESLLSRRWESLCELNIETTRYLARCLGIVTPVFDSRDLDPTGKGNEMLIGLCHRLGADHYVSNVGSSAYIDEVLFAQQGVRHQWQAFRFSEYDQGVPFLDRLSVLDMLFNLGEAAGDMVRGAGRIVDNVDEARLDDIDDPEDET